ncbi:MAG TPA: DinB family protein [Gemmatimonadota bacterium]|nr:DinB family protein [Gemmatimonadota bacterium]
MDFDLAEGIAVLRRTPGALHAFLMGLSDDWTRRNEGPDTWSPFDVVGHLIDGEETNWMVRARLILSGREERRFEPFDRFRHLRRSRDRSLPELLDRFAELRAGNLRELEGLDLGEAELRRTGEHPELGPVTLARLLATWVVHDLGHVAQVARVMARQYRGAVGPWEAYLPVLHR